MVEHAYARALSAYLLTATALVRILLQTPGCMSGMNINHLFSIKKIFLAKECGISTILNEGVAHQLPHILHVLITDGASDSRTDKV